MLLISQEKLGFHHSKEGCTVHVHGFHNLLATHPVFWCSLGTLSGDKGPDAQEVIELILGADLSFLDVGAPSFAAFGST